MATKVNMPSTKDALIESLIAKGVYKMYDGRQLYQASLNELYEELCSKYYDNVCEFITRPN